MIKYLHGYDKLETMRLYKEAFPEDSESFVSFYYDKIASGNRIIVDKEDNTICSMAHLNPYMMRVRDNKYPIDYIVAVATKADKRRKGHMRNILNHIIRSESERGVPFTFLMPANPGYYRPFGFEYIFDYEMPIKISLGDNRMLPIEQSDMSEVSCFINYILYKSYDAYCIRDDKYIERHAGEVRSNGGDIYKIVDMKDNIHGIYATENTDGKIRELITDDKISSICDKKKPYIMARILDLVEFGSNIRLKKSAKVDRKEMMICVKDEIISDNNGTWNITIDKDGSIWQKIDDGFFSDIHSYDIRELVQIMSDYHISYNDDIWKDIDVIHGIYIDEQI